jgi:hypothetical protein
MRPRELPSLPQRHPGKINPIDCVTIARKLNRITPLAAPKVQYDGLVQWAQLIEKQFTELALRFIYKGEILSFMPPIPEFLMSPYLDYFIRAHSHS